MARAKDNPQLKGRTMKDGRVSLYLQYYVSREETPVKDEDGEPVRYTTGAMKGKPKYKVTNIRRQEALNLCYRPRPRTPFEKWEKAEILNDDILNLIGTPEAGKDANAQIFALPTPTACNKTLQRWVTRAGITKHITWHCARHSFAVNLLNNGANMKTTADLLGHSSTTITEVYVRAVDGLKRAAIESLPHINLQDDGE